MHFDLEIAADKQELLEQAIYEDFVEEANWAFVACQNITL